MLKSLKTITGAVKKGIVAADKAVDGAIKEVVPK